MGPDSFFIFEYWTSHMMVKVGMKSSPGMISSKKLKMPPKIPFDPPNMRQKIIADIGAHIKSMNSPKIGIP